MKIGFIGAGKVGVSLGKYFALHGVPVAGYCDINFDFAKQAAEFTESRAFDSTEQLVMASGVIFLTVPDGEISVVWKQLSGYDIADKIIVHCSGADSSAAFDGIEARAAFGYSAHPLLAVSDKYGSYRDLQGALFTVEGSEGKMDELLKIFSDCGNKILRLPTEKKPLYHAAASVASNFSVTLVDVAQGLLTECGFSEQDALEALSGLLEGNLRNIINNGPKEALTGPIERDDAETVRLHLSVLPEEERELYKKLAERTLALAKRKHPERNYHKTEEILK